MYKNPMPPNTAPAFKNGVIYVTDQHTQKVMQGPSLAGPWTTLSNITPPKLQYRVGDPFMFIDKAGNFHITNHAYDAGQTTSCSTSWVSSHCFSADGKTWGHSDQPYGHTANFDDGTSHSYCTLERPSLNFDSSGTLNHIHFVADLITEDAGCAGRGKCTGCVNCKYADHAGTLLVRPGA